MSTRAGQNLATSPPQSRGYYQVRNAEEREGAAFRQRNHTWTALCGSVRKPYTPWRDIR